MHVFFTTRHGTQQRGGRCGCTLRCAQIKQERQVWLRMHVWEPREERARERDMRTGVRHDRERQRQREREMMIQTFYYLSLKNCSSVNTSKSHSSVVPSGTRDWATAGCRSIICGCGCGCGCDVQALMCECMGPNPCVNCTAEQYINNRSSLPLFGT